MILSDMKMRRRTKIVATLGPATNNANTLRDMIHAGMNLARFNFSHGSHEDHLSQLVLLRKVADELDVTIGIIADLQGPKIRVASFKDKKITLKKGQTFILNADLDENEGDEQQVGILYKGLINDVDTDDLLLLDDGRLTLKVTKVENNCIYTEVENDGYLSSNKGINLLGGGLSAPALTDKDKKDLAFAVKHEVDYIALSFVRNADDINQAHALIRSHGGIAGVISKIERADCLAEIELILAASDAIMVARGDLAVEIGDAKVPAVQKELIHLATKYNKPVITATQMMESMVTSVVPTRAEVSDVANAVLDGTDAVMLSEETAMGKHPAVVIAAMARSCVGARECARFTSAHAIPVQQFDRIDETIAMATLFTANHHNVKAIIALTESGATALWMSRHQIQAPIFALSRHKKSLGRMTLYRSVYPVYFDVTKYSRDQINKQAVACLKDAEEIKLGDQVILTKGDALGVGGGANAMKILVVGDVVS